MILQLAQGIKATTPETSLQKAEPAIKLIEVSISNKLPHLLNHPSTVPHHLVITNQEMINRVRLSPTAQAPDEMVIPHKKRQSLLIVHR